ncbi:MAG: hypothetical protein M3Z95_07950 [Actinomycetota bacterium]|nr:hypothetical protein [Actinomycetota bacterium]
MSVLELAPRSIGGLCSRALRFGAGVSLEQLILRRALGLGLDDLARESTASGVIPIPRVGTLRAVERQAQARAVAGIGGLEITIARGRPVVPLPDGDRYPGLPVRALAWVARARPADLHLRVGPSAVARRVAGAFAARRQLSRFA